MTTEAILYAAKSTADKKGSIPTQLDDGRAFADRHGMIVIAEFSDEAASAYHGHRGPGLAKAIALATETKASIIVQHTDRLARGDGVQAPHLAELYFWSLQGEFRFRSVQDDSTMENVIMAAVTGYRNHEDSRRKALAVTAGMRRRFERGHTAGGRRMYGYSLYNTDDTRGLLRVYEPEAAIVRRIFAEAIAGRSNMAIARDLQADGVPTMLKSTAYWRASTIQNILKNPVYIGKVTFQKEVGPGIHEPIVTQEEWDQVTVLREERRKSRGKGRGRPTAGSHLLTRGYFRCSCGDAMAPRTMRNRRSPDRGIYMCLRHWHHRDDCSQAEINSSDVDGAVFNYFERLALDVDATREALAGETHRRITELESLLAQAENEVARATDRLARVRRDYTDGNITAADWTDLRTELEGERAAATSHVDQLAAQRDELREGANLIDAETQLVQRMTDIRNAIAGRVNGAAGLDAVRAALKQTFSAFRLRTTPTAPVPADLAWVGDDHLFIEPEIREGAITDFTDDGRAILPRQPLSLPEETNDVTASEGSHPLHG